MGGWDMRACLTVRTSVAHCGTSMCEPWALSWNLALEWDSFLMNTVSLTTLSFQSDLLGSALLETANPGHIKISLSTMHPAWWHCVDLQTPVSSSEASGEMAQRVNTAGKVWGPEVRSSEPKEMTGGSGGCLQSQRWGDADPGPLEQAG